MPLHIRRLGLVIVILVGLFLVFRMVLIPDTFGDYGHYRGAAIEDNKLMEIRHVGEEACLDCHDDTGLQKSNDLHARISCESCHGPGWKHIENPEPANIILPKGRDFCGICHSINAARPLEIVAQIDLEEHNTEFSCGECHNPHAPWE